LVYKQELKLNTEIRQKFSWFKKFWQVLDFLPEVVLGITVLVTTITIFSQVVFRYVFSRPIYWADEFAVLVFAWMIFTGTVVATKYNEHLSVDTFIRMLPKRVQMVFTIVTNTAILMVIVLLFIEGLALTQKTAGLKYPAMEISRGFLYISIPVTAPLMGIYLLRTIINDIRLLVGRQNR
jgi:C4-dicarboxylate transporter DctQ subunit